MRLHVLRCALVPILALLASAAAAATSCRAGFGDVVVFEGCDEIALRELRLRFVDITTPNPDVPLSCWNYAATLADGADTTHFRQCHTGALGGHTVFELAGRSYTVLFDLGEGCVRHPAGHWTLKRRGHVFYPGELSTEKRERVERKFSRAESKCMSRPPHAASPQGAAQPQS